MVVRKQEDKCNRGTEDVFGEKHILIKSETLHRMQFTFQENSRIILEKKKTLTKDASYISII